MTDFQVAFEQLDRFIERRIKEANIPGMAVALTDREGLIRVSTYGFADVGARAPVTEDSLFEIGSIGKSFTNIALLQEHEAGRLDLHAPITRYLPWFQVQSEYAPITVHHIMSHTAGLMTGTEIAPHARYESWALRNARTSAPPGERFHYSNIGYKTLGFLLEDLLGRSYEDIIKSHVLGPTGMTATDAVITFETRKRAAVGYRCFYDDRPEHPSHPLAPALWGEYGAGDGCLASTAADMAAYLRMLMNRGQGPGGPVISEESFSLMTQRLIAAPMWGGCSYGYGLNMVDINGHACIGHGGGTPGYLSSILADMDDGLGVVILVNGLGDSYNVPGFALLGLEQLRAALHHEQTPSLPPATDPTRTENAADYAGTYRAGDKTLTLTSEDEKLVLQHGGERSILERRDTDTFYAGHPDFDLFLLEFQREDNQKCSQVVSVFHGPDWYTNDHHTGPTGFDYPKEWEAYTGHYRAHNPGISNFRVVLRQGSLMLVYPSGAGLLLVPVGDATFRIGEDEQSPESMSFDSISNGQALRASYSGCDYYRAFTP